MQVQGAHAHLPRWIPLSPSVAKIRVDGDLSITTSEGSYSAICRNSSSIYLGFSAIKCLGIVDPASLEALACQEVLSLSIDLSITHVEVA